MTFLPIWIITEKHMRGDSMSAAVRDRFESVENRYLDRRRSPSDYGMRRPHPLYVQLHRSRRVCNMWWTKICAGSSLLRDSEHPRRSDSCVHFLDSHNCHVRSQKSKIVHQAATTRTWTSSWGNADVVSFGDFNALMTIHKYCLWAQPSGWRSE